MTGPHDKPSPPRYRPQLPLPPYTYVPGRSPHPNSDAAGHLYGHAPLQPSPLDDSNWSTHDVYLQAVDLFNHGYYWEAHEAWEAAWHAVGRVGPLADMLKGLIKLAAAGVKVREGRPAGIVAHTERAAELFEASYDDGPSRRLGLDFGDLQTLCRVVAAQPPRPDDGPTAVRPLDGIRLVLRED
jgi:hypothetical protein